MKNINLYIDGNKNFNEENGVTGGKGTVEDPYVIEGWKINCNIYDGIVIRNTNLYFIIKNCYVYDGGVDKDGIVFYNVTNGTIESNIIKGNRNGVMFRTQHSGRENSNDNTISNNSIEYNTNDGIHFQHTGWDWHSNNCIISNDIFSNTRGIYLIMSAENQIIYNNIILNDYYGVQLDMCMGGGEINIIHHNNFIDNKGDEAQVCEWGDPLNFWNDSYPSGGNFWSDYKGNDSYHGHNQDIQGNDGIGDIPYDIPEGNNQDNYPLMEPWNITNNPPEKPTIIGESSGKTGVEYEYTFASTDPEQDQISYFIDWDDDTSSGWTRRLPSGNYYNSSHTWNEKGEYIIKAKAKDIYGAESDWVILTVTMPKTYIDKAILHFILNLLERFPLFEKILNQII